MKTLRSLWRALRTLSGDDAYERYVAHHRAHHADARVLTPREFYLDEQRRRYSGVSRCC